MKLALSSLNQIWEDKDGNFELCLAEMESAAHSGAELIVFPEMTLTGFSSRVEALAEDMESSTTLRRFREAARGFGIPVVFGAIIGQPGRKARNVALMIDKSGQLIGSYSKIHPFSMAGENLHFAAGTEVVFAGLDGWSVGLSICYDLRFPEIFAILAPHCDLILNIANWPAKRVDHWRTLLKARAIENQVFVAGVNRTGVDGRGLEYQESSLVFDAYGSEVMPAEARGSLKLFSIDQARTREIKEKFNFFADRQPELYRTLMLKHQSGQKNHAEQ
jgi:omega-amidase